jgi:serine/threonine-protein kinase
MVDSDEKKGVPAAQAQPMEAPLIGGRYKVTRKLGAGQMGEVVEAEDVLLRKPVAVKVIREQYARDPGFADRLRLEAQAVAAVAARSAHVVSALDLGQAPDGRAYIVFERLNGRTLRDELRARKFLPPAEAIALMQQLLDGLAAAHDAGVIHRDIKHENVYLCDGARAEGERVLKILDFGLAKVIDPSAAGAPTPLALPTAKGMIVGTPRFVAPEQILGQSIDHRADLYSAGVVLYMLLAGRDPFHHHREMFDILAAQVKEAPKPPSTQAEQPIPEALDRIVLRALAKAPGDRFPDARAFAAALAQVDLARSRSVQRSRWPETERVDLRAFQAQPSPAATAKTTRLPSAAALVDDETVATLPLAAQSTTVRPALMTPPPVPQWVTESRRPIVPLRRKLSRVQLAALAILLALAALALGVLVVHWLRR